MGEGGKHYAKTLCFKKKGKKRPHSLLFHLYEMSRIDHFMEAESRFVAPKGRRLRKMGSDY